MVRKKRRITSDVSSSGENEGAGSAKRPFWRKSDAELVKDRIGDVRSYLDDRTIKVDEKDRDEALRSAAGIDPNVVNFLDMVPVRRKGLERDGEFLKVPVYRSGFGKKMAERFDLRTKRGIRLDEYGWAIWDLSNGVRDIRKIGELVKKRFGEEIDPLYPRLSKFYAYMVKLELMKITDKNTDDN